MGKDQFLNPHLDNSHDKDRNLWRVLNLLYYVTPSWEKEYGGNLELWPNGLENKPITIHSKFNRLVVMATHQTSLHSVSPVQFEGYRCCVSNYYFSKHPFKVDDRFHVTSFRGRPNEKIKDKILQLDSLSYVWEFVKYLKKELLKTLMFIKKERINLQPFFERLQILFAHHILRFLKDILAIMHNHG